MIPSASSMRIANCADFRCRVVTYLRLTRWYDRVRLAQSDGFDEGHIEGREKAG